MKLLTIFRELEELAGRLGLEVVQDRGTFNGGRCLLEGESKIVLNRSAPLEQRARLLAEIIAGQDLSDVYVKPAVRNFIAIYEDLFSPDNT